MLSHVKKAYTFDDLLLVPKYSEITSRSEEFIDTSVDLGKGVVLKIPLVSANMTNVTETQMADAISELGGLPIMHRFCSIDEQIDMWQDCDNGGLVAQSVGVGPKSKERLDILSDNGCDMVCVDVAHGDHKLSVDMVTYIAKTYPTMLLIAGNVATASGATRLYNAGADVIKVGIGPGSLCTTRLETGNGVPQMSALAEVFEESCSAEPDTIWPHCREIDKSKRKFKIIADGGIRQGGDIVKALCFADAVMLGSILAGTDEAPGRIVTVNGRRCKRYEGSSTHKTSHIEGVKALVPCKGPVKMIVNSLMEGVRSGLSYQGSPNLTVLKENPQFRQVTNAGLIESRPHTVVVR
jgi:IMP dehydrogenase